MTQITFDGTDRNRTKYAALHWIHHNHHPRISVEENSRGVYVVLDAPHYAGGNTARIPQPVFRDMIQRGWIELRNHEFDSRMYKVTKKGQRVGREHGWAFMNYRGW